MDTYSHWMSNDHTGQVPEDGKEVGSLSTATEPCLSIQGRGRLMFQAMLPSAAGMVTSLPMAVPVSKGH